MYAKNFDRLVRALSAASTRRQFGTALVALGVPSVAALDPVRGEADARKKRRKRRKWRRCRPRCAGKTCGGDGCGGSCGECGILSVCINGSCELFCTPDCTGKTCGSNGCFGSCGTCFPPFVCKENGTCGI